MDFFRQINEFAAVLSGKDLFNNYFPHIVLFLKVARNKKTFIRTIHCEIKFKLLLSQNQVKNDKNSKNDACNSIGCTKSEGYFANVIMADNAVLIE